MAVSATFAVLVLAGAARAGAYNPLKWQVRNCRPTDTISVWNYQAEDPFARPKPIEIEGVRNGVFSGRLIASSSGAPIANMRGSATGLTHSDGLGAIPAAAVRVRFAEKAVRAKSWNHPSRFDGLLDEPPKKVGIMRVRYKGNERVSPPAAVVPVWITVRIPADAAPGEYRGSVTIEQEGTGPLEVPVKLKVHDWALPDPVDFATRQMGFTSPESVAEHYGVELWSDEHFKYMGESLEWMAKVGSRQAIADLSVNMRTRGNEQTLIRWIKQDDGSYKYDFSPFDRYLDLVEKTLGTPRPLRLNIWGQLQEKKNEETGEQELRFVYGCAKSVSLLDPATGTVENLEQPLPGTEACRTFWSPVMAEIRKRLKARRWLEVTGIGDCRYAGLPRKQTVSMAKALWPDGQWCSTQHGKPSRFKASDGSTMPVLTVETVWREGRLHARGYRGLWKPKRWLVTCSYARNRHRDYSPLWVLRALPEEMIMRGHHGVGPLGVDSWPIEREKGRPYVMGGNSALGPNCSTRAILAPGPDGPVATERYEAFRLGVQACEAIAFLQRALDEKKIEGALARRVDELLQRRADQLFALCQARRSKKKDWTRIRALTEKYETGCDERDSKLFAAAAEVSKTVK